MGYKYSKVDEDNKKWFKVDIMAKSLMEIELFKGNLRGLKPCKMRMEYPISVIAGKNGSGKSTLLALACCAYHNSSVGYTPSDHNKTYYTFSDFFIQTADENKIEAIEIRYRSINHWKNSNTKKEYEGEGFQRRYKNKGGKWNNYQTRAKRNVIFSGIQRIVPPGERKTEKSYSSKFKSIKFDEQTKQKILDIASKILLKDYHLLDLRTVDRRKLFVVDRNKSHYSGFNMGAGENVIFTLLIELFSAGRDTLLVIDEIELGLHEEAQRRLIDELKKISLELHCQIICSTHSAIIIDSVPPEARFFVESTESKSEIYSGISSAFALGRLSGGREKELVVFTEDEVGKSVITASISQEIRERIRIIPIGSDQAVLKQLSSKYREGKLNCLAFLDGDKRKNHNNAKKQVINHLESRVGNDIDEWLNKRLCYLPGNEWPEKYLVKMGKNNVVSELIPLWKIEKDKLEEYLSEAVIAGKHNEFTCLARKTDQDVSVVKSDIIRCLAEKCEQEFNIIMVSIKNILNEL